jgi:hypothetical protein
VTDGQSVSQSVSLGVEPHLGLMTRYLLLFDSYGLVLWGAIFVERTGPFFVYPAEPRQRSLVTIFYCLRFETSFFVASYDSQGHGGGIRPRLNSKIVSLIAASHGPRRKRCSLL